MNEQSIGQWQQSVNEQTKDAWDLFASHRVQMTALIEQAVGVLPLSFGKPTLCVLGAGNGNDLDLAKIAPQFSEIRLVDLDPTALGRVKDRYADQPEVVENVQFSAGIDVSGVAGLLPDLKPEMTEAEVRSVYERTLASECDLADRYDIVISTCLLTQLIDAVVHTLGRDGTLVLLLTLGMRDGHLNLLARLRKPNGRVILATDFVSSDTLPELKTVEDADAVIKLSRQAIERRNFFTGANPFSIREKLVELKHVAGPSDVDIASPWRWQFGGRCYLATALSY